MFWEGKELAPMSTCPLLADFVEKRRERLLLAICGRARVRGRMDDSICPAIIESLLRKNGPELLVGEFFNTIGTSETNGFGGFGSAIGVTPDTAP